MTKAYTLYQSDYESPLYIGTFETESDAERAKTWIESELAKQLPELNKAQLDLTEFLDQSKDSLTPVDQKTYADLVFDIEVINKKMAFSIGADSINKWPDMSFYISSLKIQDFDSWQKELKPNLDQQEYLINDYIELMTEDD